MTQGDVLAGDQTIASTGDTRRAQYVRGVLLHDPEMTAIRLPADAQLGETVQRWEEAIAVWQGRFEEKADATLSAIADDRLRRQIRERALVLLHAR